MLASKLQCLVLYVTVDPSLGVQTVVSSVTIYNDLDGGRAYCSPQIADRFLDVSFFGLIVICLLAVRSLYSGTPLIIAEDYEVPRVRKDGDISYYRVGGR